MLLIFGLLIWLLLLHLLLQFGDVGPAFVADAVPAQSPMKNVAALATSVVLAETLHE